MALLIGGVYLYPSLRAWLPDLDSQPEYRFRTSDLRTNAPHRWVPANLTERVLSDAGVPEEVSLLDESLAPRIAAAFAAQPWVAGVETVRISRHHGIEVRLTYRVPVLMVETQGGGGMYPVDRDGILLPPADFTPDDIAEFPKLRGIESPPTGGSGSAWGNPVVLAGARLAEVLTPDGDLERYWRRFQLSAIEPAQEEAGVPVTFELATAAGSRIIWGRPPGEDELEPSVEQKLGRLESYFAGQGGSDSPQSRRRIDIRHFDAIEVISLEGAQGGRLQ